MKFLVIAALLVVASAAPQDVPAGLVSAKSEMNADGSYSYSFETEDKIKVEETGSQKLIGEESGTVASGSYSFEHDGVTYTVTWVADENGFQATGDHLPKRK